MTRVIAKRTRMLPPFLNDKTQTIRGIRQIRSYRFQVGLNPIASHPRQRYSSIQILGGRDVTLQNRVTPFGEIVAVDARGSWMGNRGCLHDDNRKLGHRRWTHQSWVICKLEFNGRRRLLMQPGKYTELFFLDEATALAAGHRPCGTCRRDDLLAFLDAWRRGNGDAAAGLADVDRRLHVERVDEQRRQRTWQTRACNLPDGTMIAEGEQAYLIWEGLCYPWSPDGYRAASPLPAESPVEVLTPRATVGALAAGYLPSVHLSIPSLVDP